MESVFEQDREVRVIAVSIPGPLAYTVFHIVYTYSRWEMAALVDSGEINYRKLEIILSSMAPAFL